MDKVIMTVAILPMAEEFGWSSMEAGAVQSAVFLGYLLLQVPAGYLVSRYGGPALLPAALGIWSAATALVPIAASGGIGSLCLARALVGLGMAAAPAAVVDIIVRSAPADRRASSTALAFSGQHAGSVLGLMAAPLLISQLDWRTMFAVCGSAGALWWFAFAELMARLTTAQHASSTAASSPATSCPPGRDSSSSSGGHHAAYVSDGRMPPYRAFLRDPSVRMLMMTHFCKNWFNYTMLTWLPTYFKATLSLSLAGASQTALLPPLAGIAAAAIAGAAADGLIRAGVPVPAVRKGVQSMALLAPAAMLGGLIVASGADPVGTAAMASAAGVAGDAAAAAAASAGEAAAVTAAVSDAAVVAAASVGDAAASAALAVGDAAVAAASTVSDAAVAAAVAAGDAAVAASNAAAAASGAGGGVTGAVVVATLTAALAMNNFSLAGLYCTHQDISPKYASVLLSLTNTAGALPGVLGVWAVGALLASTGGDWNTALFAPSALLLAAGAACYNLGVKVAPHDFDANPADNRPFEWEERLAAALEPLRAADVAARERAADWARCAGEALGAGDNMWARPLLVHSRVERYDGHAYNGSAWEDYNHDYWGIDDDYYLEDAISRQRRAGPAGAGNGAGDVHDAWGASARRAARAVSSVRSELACRLFGFCEMR